MSADRKGHRLQKKWEKEDAATWENGLSEVLRTPLGRRLLWLMLEEAGVFQDPFASNALEMSRNCGRQDQGRRLLDKITAVHPDAFLVMMKENQDVQHRRKSDADDARSRAGAEFDDPDSDD